MTVNDESQLSQSSTQVLTIERQPPQAVLSFSTIHNVSGEGCEGGNDLGSFETHNRTHRDADLSDDGRRHGFGVILGMRMESKGRDELVRSGNVSTSCSECCSMRRETEVSSRRNGMNFPSFLHFVKVPIKISTLLGSTPK